MARPLSLRLTLTITSSWTLLSQVQAVAVPRPWAALQALSQQAQAVLRPWAALQANTRQLQHVWCQYSNEPNSRGISTVEVEDSAQSFTTFDGACIRRAGYRCLDQLVAESLMVCLGWRSTWTACGGAVVLLGDEIAIPTQQSVRCHDAGHPEQG